jgi:hypothetical protein
VSVKLDIPDRLFERIQKHAIPFVDLSPAAVIERWADHYEATAHPVIQPSAPPPSPPQPAGKKFNEMSPPELFHTRVRGRIAGKHFSKWNDLVRVAHVIAMERAGSLASLKTATRANIRDGNHEGVDGFHFVPEINASIQGVDANKAWELSLRLAKFANVPLSAQFEWRQNPNAAFPGETGHMEWKPE